MLLKPTWQYNGDFQLWKQFSIVQDHTDTFADSACLTVIGVVAAAVGMLLKPWYKMV